MHKQQLSSMDHIKADDSLKERTLNKVLKHESIPFISFKKLSFACLVVILVASLSLLKPVNAKPYTFITLDINPSLEIVLDQKDRVIEFNAFNKEAELLINALDITGLSYSQALENLMSNESYRQYFTDESFLQVSIYSKDKAKAIDIEKQVCNYLDTSQMKNKYSCSCVDEGVHNTAKQHHMSSGKYMMIEAIIKIDSTRSLEELEILSMSQLKTIYYELTGEMLNSHQKRQHHKGM